MESGGFGNFADAHTLTTPDDTHTLVTADDKPRVDDLTTAAARGDFLEVTRIIDSGVDVNEVNIYGRTALQVGLYNRVSMLWS